MPQLLNHGQRYHGATVSELSQAGPFTRQIDPEEARTYFFTAQTQTLLLDLRYDVEGEVTGEWLRVQNNSSSGQTITIRDTLGATIPGGTVLAGEQVRVMLVDSTTTEGTWQGLVRANGAGARHS